MSTDQRGTFKKVIDFLHKFLTVNQKSPLFGVSVNWRLDCGNITFIPLSATTYSYFQLVFDELSSRKSHIILL